MKNAEHWKPSKFIYKNNKLIASRNPNTVGIASRLVVDIVAAKYEANLKNHVTGRLIDLGCGDVPLYEAYKNYCLDCTCADWENTKHKNPYLDYTCNLNEPLPFKKEEFDTIVLSDVLEHILYPDRLWFEMSRILAPGGKIILNVPFFYKLHERPHDYFRYTEYALENFAKSSGFKIIMLKSIGGVPEILTDITSKNIVRIPGIGKYLAILFQKICSLFIRTSVGKRISEKTGKQLRIKINNPGFFIKN